MALGALTRSFQRGRRKQDDTSYYEVRGFKLQLPTEHALPRYQAAHRLYDRFIGVLGDCLPQDSLVLDIGANIGDSAAALCGTGRKRIICVEGSKSFFQFLTRNAQLIEARGNRITCVRAIVGPEEASGLIAEADSTGTTVISETGSPMRSLDQIAEDFCTDRCAPILIKVDTDGYDAAVIMSGPHMIGNHQPLLFWENEIWGDSNLRKYYDTYDFLHELSYTIYTVFDNFGNIMLDNTDRRGLRDIARYIATLNDGLSTRTIYYVDVLASSDKYREIHLAAVQTYREQFCLKPQSNANS